MTDDSRTGEPGTDASETNEPGSREHETDILGPGTLESEVPNFAAARDHVHDELVGFVRALRRAGVTVPANAGTTAGRALAEIGFGDRERAQVGLRACLVTERADRSTFDTLFSEFWRRLTAGLGPTGPAGRPEDGPDGGLASFDAEPAPGERDDGTEDETSEDAGETDQRGEREELGAVVGREAATAGEDETEDVTAAQYSPTGERTAVSVPGVAGIAGEERFDGAFRALTDALAELPGRRWRAGDDTPDVRRALRASVATGGAVLDVPRREHERSAVRACLLVDVSRSVLDVLDRSFLVRFLRRARAEWRDARVFFFDDDLREVTDSFDARTPKAALDALERAEAEWGGGTRIGGSLARLHETAPETVTRESAVFVVSDGLEMGDVSALEREAAWLSRRAGAVFWLNPLAVSPAYEPTARGMAAALPYLDGLFAFAGPADLAEMARQLDRQGPRGRIGYEYDPRRIESETTQRKQPRPTS